jgi:hypothetical protein
MAQVPNRFTARCRSSTDRSPSSSKIATPALLTRTSSESTCSTPAWICAGWVMSSVSGVTRRSRRTYGCRVPAHTRFAPRLSASSTSARPRPQLVPMTRTELSAMFVLLLITSSLVSFRVRSAGSAESIAARANLPSRRARPLGGTVPVLAVPSVSPLDDRVTNLADHARAPAFLDGTRSASRESVSARHRTSDATPDLPRPWGSGVSRAYILKLATVPAREFPASKQAYR